MPPCLVTLLAGLLGYLRWLGDNGLAAISSQQLPMLLILAGALALVLQVRPSAGPEEAKRILLDTADDLGPGGPDNDSGYGLLNVPAAVQRANAAFAGGLLQASLLRRTRDSLYVSVGNRGSAGWTGGDDGLEQFFHQPGADRRAGVGRFRF